jgi:hypothetical protein
MEEGNNEGLPDLPTKYGGIRYTLETYRDERVEANVRRLAMERNAAGIENLTVAPYSTSAESPRRRAVLRETSMPSSFEHVNYNMPETVPQEVVQRRQVARDMVDPGISSDGHRIADIVHLPPRHATLSPPAVQRSSRDLILSRDRAMAADVNLAPLPRPYVPRGLVDANCEPYQYDRGRNKRDALRAQIRSEGAEICQASRNLERNLGTATADTGPKSMDLAGVQAAADILVASDTDLNIGRNDILATLQDLQQNWYPNELVLVATRIFRPMLKLRTYPNDEVAQLARDLIKEWRETIRVVNGHTPTVAGEDPFVDEEAENYGRTIPRQAWDNAIRDRQAAARDFNNAASAETRAAEQRRRNNVQRQRQDREDEDLRLHMQRLRSNGKTNPSSNIAGADPKEGSNARANGRNTDSTITDHNADPVLSSNQNFEVAEVDPSPERPQRGPGNNVLRERPEDTPVQSIEVDWPAGLCHECPGFPRTYHHICVGNPQCDNLRARTRPARQRTSPSYGPSQSLQTAGHTTDEMIRAAREGIARLQETARSRAATRPVTNPANVPEGMDDPFRPTERRNAGLGLQKFGGILGQGTDEVSPSKGRMPQAQRETTPTVPNTPVPGASPTEGAGEAQMPRPTWADYAASTSPEPLHELQGRQSSPVSGAGIGKDGLIRMLMTQDASGNRGYGAPSGLNTGVVRNGSQGSNGVSPLNLDFSEFTGPAERASHSASAPSSRAGPGTGNKRPSPRSSNEPLRKRLRGSNGVRKTL